MRSGATTLTCETFEKSNERKNLEKEWIDLCNKCKSEDTGCSFPPEPCENMFDCKSCENEKKCQDKLNCKFDGTCSLKSCDSWKNKHGVNVCQSIQGNCKPNYKKELFSEMKFKDYLVACGNVVYIGVYSHNIPGDTLYLKIKNQIGFGSENTFLAENITNHSKYYGLRCINIRVGVGDEGPFVMKSEVSLNEYVKVNSLRFDFEGNINLSYSKSKNYIGETVDFNLIKTLIPGANHGGHFQFSIVKPSNRDYTMDDIDNKINCHEFAMTESKFDTSLPKYKSTYSKIHEETIDNDFDVFIDSLWDPALEFFKYGDPIDPCGNLVCAVIAFNLFFLYSKYCRQKSQDDLDSFAFTQEDRVFITLSFIFHKKQTNKYIDKYEFIYDHNDDGNKNACALGCATRVNKIVKNDKNPPTYHPQMTNEQFITLLCCDKKLENEVCPPYTKEEWKKGRKPNLLFRYFFSIYQVFRKFATVKNEYEKGTIDYISQPLVKAKKKFLDKVKKQKQIKESLDSLLDYNPDTAEGMFNKSIFFNWFCRRCREEKDFYDEYQRGDEGCIKVCDGQGNVNPQFNTDAYDIPNLKEFQKQQPDLKEEQMPLFPRLTLKHTQQWEKKAKKIEKQLINVQKELNKIKIYLEEKPNDPTVKTREGKLKTLLDELTWNARLISYQLTRNPFTSP